MRRPPPDPDPSGVPARATSIRTGAAGRVRGDLRIGHSTLVIEFDGATVLTDPIWGGPGRRPLRQFKRWVPPPVPLEGLPRIDVVVLSHSHYDHLDAPTVRKFAKLQPGAAWCVPLGLGRLVRRFGVRLEELDWWEERTVGTVRIAAAPARHFSARGPFDRNRALWCGFAIRAGSRSAYFTSDTACHPDFGEAPAPSRGSTSRSCRSAPTIRAGSCTSST